MDGSSTGGGLPHGVQTPEHSLRSQEWRQSICGKAEERDLIGWRHADRAGASTLTGGDMSVAACALVALSTCTGTLASLPVMADADPSCQVSEVNRLLWTLIVLAS